MSIPSIAWIASLVILTLILLGGAFSGIRKGAYRAGVKLIALVLSVVISLIISLCLRGVLSDILSDTLLNILPEFLQGQTAIVELIAQIAAAAVLLVMFWLIFTVVRLLMLIPQKIISNLLPKKLEDIQPRKKVKVATAHVTAEASTDESAE